MSIEFFKMAAWLGGLIVEGGDGGEHQKVINELVKELPENITLIYADDDEIRLKYKQRLIQLDLWWPIGYTIKDGGDLEAADRAVIDNAMQKKVFRSKYVCPPPWGGEELY